MKLITQERLVELLRKEYKLTLLENYGVDNWDEYSRAMNDQFHTDPFSYNDFLTLSDEDLTKDYEDQCEQQKTSVENNQSFYNEDTIEVDKIRIESQSQLDNLIDEETERQGSLECFILLNFGLRSFKEISFTPQRDYSVYNECDNTEEIISHDELMQSFIGKALSSGVLYKY